MAVLRTNVFVDGSWYGPAHEADVSDEVADKVDPDLLEAEPVKAEAKPAPAKAASTAKKK